MALIVRFECDAPGCEAHVAIDALHHAGPEQVYDVGVRRDGRDAIVGIEVDFRLEGWYAGALASFGGAELRTFCEAHGAGCEYCGGRGWVGDSPSKVHPCEACEGYGVVQASAEETARRIVAARAGVPLEYMAPADVPVHVGVDVASDDEESFLSYVLQFPLPSPEDFREQFEQVVARWEAFMGRPLVEDKADPPAPRALPEVAGPLEGIVNVQVCPHAMRGQIVAGCPLTVNGLDGPVTVCAGCPARDRIAARFGRVAEVLPDGRARIELGRG